jgi:hypothetical protein
MNNINNYMKKQSVIMISVVVAIAIIIGCVFLFKGNSSKQNNNINPQSQEQNIEEVTIDSLSVGNWVSVVAEKSNGSYTVSMIMVCDSKDSCQNSGSGTQAPSSENAPTGEAPTGTPPAGGTAPSGETPSGTAPTNNKTGSNMANKTMLSGTITEVNSDNIVLSLDTGETATVSISDTTKITKR